MIVKSQLETNTVDASCMKCGQIGVIKAGIRYTGHLLKTFSGFVLLEDPALTWCEKLTGVVVVLLPKGSIITLEVEN